MIDIVKSVGIEKVKPFEPGAKTRAMLDEAAAEPRAWLDARFETILSSASYEGGRWAVPVSREMIAGQQTFFADPASYPVDDRGVSCSMAFFRLTVPPDVPVTQYWSATVCDRATHALIRDTQRSSVSSQSPGLMGNADGSVDVYFAPAPPPGHAENWVPTNRDGDFEVLFRFYGPQEPVFDKTWRLHDIAKQT